MDLTFFKSSWGGAIVVVAGIVDLVKSGRKKRKWKKRVPSAMREGKILTKLMVKDSRVIFPSSSDLAGEDAIFPETTIHFLF